MTPLERALSKAYSRHQAAGDEPHPESRAAAGPRGWVHQLRAPLEPADADGPDPFVRTDPQHAGFARRLREPASAGRVAVTGAPQAEPAPQAPVLAPTAPPESVAGEPDSVVWSWPEICARLLDSSAGADLRRLAARIEAVPRAKLPCAVAFTGPGRSAGRTALLLALARILLESCDRRVLVVDAHAQHPGIASGLGLTVRSSSKDAGSAAAATLSGRPIALSGRLSVCAAPALDGRKEPPAGESTAAESARDGAFEGFDVVLVDAGPSEGLLSVAERIFWGIDAVVSVSRFGSPAAVETARQLCQRLGARLLGVVETFVPAPGVAPPHLRPQMVSG